MNYFIETLKKFLDINISDDIKIHNINIWKKNNNIKITVILKKINNFANIEDCAMVHRLIKLWVKKENIQNHIQIEVQSEAINKKLIHLQDFHEHINHFMKIELKEKQDNIRHLKGFLIELKDDMLLLRVQDNNYAINFNNIKKANIMPEI